MPERRIVRERVAAQSAMHRVVAAQAAAPARTPIARLFGITPLVAASRTPYRVALAELVVGDALEQLGVQWDVLHDLPLSAGVLDHLAVGPAGVFAVRAVQCEGADVVVDDDGIVIGAERRGDLAVASANAAEVAGILRVPVQPLLALVASRRTVVRTEAPVVAATDVLRTLTRAPRTMTGDEVAAVSDLADLGSTWPQADAAALDTQQLHRDFAVIREGVRRAVNRRVLWIVGVATVLFSIVWALIATFVRLVIGS